MSESDQLRLDGEDREAVDATRTAAAHAAETLGVADLQATAGHVDLRVEPFQRGEQLVPSGSEVGA
jgi:hypothetical protein